MSLREALQEPIMELPVSELRPIRVAVIDSGVDSSHPALAGRVDAAFEVTVTAGRTAVRELPTEHDNDVFGHGTGVAGIVCDVAPNARIIDVRVLDANNRGTGLALVAGLRHAVDLGVPVLNMSLAARRSVLEALYPLCERAYVNGQVVVAAQRNMPLQDYGLPAEFSSVLSVNRGTLPRLTATRYVSGAVIEFEAFGDHAGVPARGGGSTTKTGSSFAAPVISGLVARLLGRWPDLRPFEVKALLKAHGHVDG